MESHSITVAEALKIAHETSPHDHNIINHPSPQLRIFASGCGGPKAREVLSALNEMVILHPERKPDVMVILGDNYYPDGLPSPDDVRVQEEFFNVFADEKLTAIHDIPCLIILGNHDAGRSTETDIYSYFPNKAKNMLGSVITVPTNPLRFDEAELQQVAVTYLRAKNPEIFNQKDIDYRHLPKHCMLSRFDTYTFDSLRLFCLNTNTYAREFYEMLKAYACEEFADMTKSLAAWLEEKYAQAKNDGKAITNQAMWLPEKYAKAILDELAILYATHHAFFSCNKRYYSSGWDAHHYLTTEMIVRLQVILRLDPEDKALREKLKNIFTQELSVLEKNEHCTENVNHNELLANIICKFQKLPPHLIISAHDHAMYTVPNHLLELGDTWQVVSGGLGSLDLQYRMYFGDEMNFSREHGFTLISCDKNNPYLFDIDIHTLGWSAYLKSIDEDISIPQLSFTTSSNQPKREQIMNDDSKELNDKLVDIRQAVLEVCNKYRKFLHDKQGKNGDFFPSLKSILKLKFFNYNNKHRLEDVDRMHEILCFFNSPKPFNYQITIYFLFEKLKMMMNKDSENSLHLDMQDKLKSVLGRSLEDEYDALSTKQNNKLVPVNY
ncbi:MAG: metallophosphoesterase [Gammaproteobacteria bacterium]|nr:metallophosphoesterase [Gammaproteobacteria bacterium]